MKLLFKFRFHCNVSKKIAPDLTVWKLKKRSFSLNTQKIVTTPQKKSHLGKSTPKVDIWLVSWGFIPFKWNSLIWALPLLDSAMRTCSIFSKPIFLFGERIRTLRGAVADWGINRRWLSQADCEGTSMYKLPRRSLSHQSHFQVNFLPSQFEGQRMDVSSSKLAEESNNGH